MNACCLILLQEPNCMIPTLMAQQVFVPTLLADTISFDKITVSDVQQQVTTGISSGTIIA